MRDQLNIKNKNSKQSGDESWKGAYQKDWLGFCAKKYEQMPQILEDLKKIKGELNQLGYSGRFELFTYENFPYNHYMMVDPDEDNGKLLLSSYIHGIGRGYCPVMEIRKNTARVTFNTYLESLQMILKEAKAI